MRRMLNTLPSKRSLKLRAITLLIARVGLAPQRSFKALQHHHRFGIGVKIRLDGKNPAEHPPQKAQGIAPRNCNLSGPCKIYATNGLKVQLTNEHSCGFAALFGNKGTPRGYCLMRFCRLYSHLFGLHLDWATCSSPPFSALPPTAVRRCF